MASLLASSTFHGVRVPSNVQVYRRPRVSTEIRASRTIEGKVVSTSAQKTITVVVDRYQVRDARYGKRERLSKKYHVHDESEECEVGDTVQLATIPKVSKTKAFKVDKIVRKVVKL